MSKTLIAYFSRTGQNYVNGSIRNLTKGNTEIAAEMAAEMTGGELFKIEPVTKYAYDYNECIEEAQQDKRSNARPELEQYLDHIDDIDTIILGYPNYWGTMPMAVFTFLEKYDFTGKTIKPFCTHEGSGMGSSEGDIKKLCPTANVEKGLAIHGADVSKAGPAIKKWLNK